jgi:hypothetical protein
VTLRQCFGLIGESVRNRVMSLVTDVIEACWLHALNQASCIA